MGLFLCYNRDTKHGGKYMAYNKHIWTTQELITSDKLNNIETGIDDLQNNLSIGTNLIENSDFFNGLTGWTVNNTDTGKTQPFRTHDAQMNDVNVVEFDTTSNGASSYGQLFKQLYFDMTPTDQVISVSWWSKASTLNLYSNWSVRFYDSNNKELFNNANNTRYSFTWVKPDQTIGAYVFNKKENISVPDNTYRMMFQIETREGNNVFLAKPRLVVGSSINNGYVSGQNNSFSGLTTSNLTVSGVLSSK